MALSNYERVGKAVQLLAEGLVPFVDRECRAEFGDNWRVVVQRRDTWGGGGRLREVNPGDAQFLLKVIWAEWHTIFSKKAVAQRSQLRLGAPGGAQRLGPQQHLLHR